MSDVDILIVWPKYGKNRFNLELIGTLSCLVPFDAEFNLEYHTKSIKHDSLGKKSGDLKLPSGYFAQNLNNLKLMFTRDQR